MRLDAELTFKSTLERRETQDYGRRAKGLAERGDKSRDLSAVRGLLMLQIQEYEKKYDGEERKSRRQAELRFAPLEADVCALHILDTRLD